MFIVASPTGMEAATLARPRIPLKRECKRPARVVQAPETNDQYAVCEYGWPAACMAQVWFGCACIVKCSVPPLAISAYVR